MIDQLKPTKPIEGSAYRLAHTLPQHLHDALDQLRRSKPMRQALGEAFVEALIVVKAASTTPTSTSSAPGSASTCC